MDGLLGVAGMIITRALGILDHFRNSLRLAPVSFLLAIKKKASDRPDKHESVISPSVDPMFQQTGLVQKCDSSVQVMTVMTV
jgi:hypothetical protein